MSTNTDSLTTAASPFALWPNRVIQHLWWAVTFRPTFGRHTGPMFLKLPRSKHLCCNVFNTGRDAAVNNGVNVCTLTASLYTDCHRVNSLFTQRVIHSWQLASLLNVTLTEVTVPNASTEDVHLPKCQQVSETLQQKLFKTSMDALLTRTPYPKIYDAMTG